AAIELRRPVPDDAREILRGDGETHTDGRPDGRPLLLMPLAPAKEPRGHARDNRKRLDVVSDDRACADNRALANMDAGKQHGVDADVGPRADARRLDFEIGLNDRDVVRQARVLRSQRTGARPPADVLLDDQVARIEVALRADPRVGADDAAAIRASLDERLLADEHAIADVERLEVRADRAAADADVVP